MLCKRALAMRVLVAGANPKQRLHVFGAGRTIGEDLLDLPMQRVRIGTRRGERCNASLPLMANMPADRRQEKRAKAAVDCARLNFADSRAVGKLSAPLTSCTDRKSGGATLDP